MASETRSFTISQLRDLLTECRASLNNCQAELSKDAQASRYVQESMVNVDDLASTTHSLAATALSNGLVTDAKVLGRLGMHLDKVSAHSRSGAQAITNAAIEKSSMRSNSTNSSMSSFSSENTDNRLLNIAIMQVEKDEFGIKKAYSDTEKETGFDPVQSAQNVADTVAAKAETEEDEEATQIQSEEEEEEQEPATLQNKLIPVPGRNKKMDNCMKLLMQHYPGAFTDVAHAEYETSKHLSGKKAPSQLRQAIANRPRSGRSAAAAAAAAAAAQQDANDVRYRRSSRTKKEPDYYVPGKY